MKVGLIHSTRLVIPWVEEAAQPFLSRVTFLHGLDEALIIELAKGQGVTEGARRRIEWLAKSLIGAGADRLVLTCSSLSPVVDLIAPELGVPFVKIDTAMIRAAVNSRKPFIILATNPSTRDPMHIIVAQEASHLNTPKGLQIVESPDMQSSEMQQPSSQTCKNQLGTLGCSSPLTQNTTPAWQYELLDDAFAALNRGDTQAHDTAVISACERFAREGIHILFAQISMARVLSRLSPVARALVTTSLDYFHQTIAIE
ncbi:MAG: aspartate/glutamate racemase family protein [Spirochaetaceae bacterium]|nr:aspartate/glutamate racemase family protein [Spirochaetaceae bacterium]